MLNFRNKKQDENEKVIEELAQRCKAQIDKAVTHIEELKQDRLYYLCIDGNQEELQNVMKQLQAVKSRMRWTPPNIFVTNKKLKELTEEELKELKKANKKLRGEKT